MRIVDPPEAWTPEDFGSHLFDALLSGGVRGLFNQSIGRVESAPGQRGLRLRLHFDLEDRDLLQIASLPWEYLYWRARREFLCLSSSTPVVRHLSVERPARHLEFEGSLRILVLMSPSAPLDLDKERRRIEETWGSDSRIEPIFLNPVTTRDLARALEQNSFHVVHFMGHGKFFAESGEGALIFAREGDRTETVTGRNLAMWLRDQDKLRLVLLNACDTAHWPGEEGVDPFAGVATALVKAGVPSVVAMQFPISDRAAIAFSEAFYAQFVKSLDPAQAVVSGRKAIIGDHVGTQEWGTPVLFERHGGRRHRSQAASDPATSDPATSEPEKSRRRVTLSKLGVSAVAVALATAFVPVLGLRAQRVREAYLALSDVTYPLQALFATGADALLGLFRNGLAALLSTTPAVRGSVLGALALAIVALWVVPKLDRRSPFLGQATLGVLALILVFGLRFFDAAIFPFADRWGRQPAECVGTLSDRPKMTELIAFETCSWLSNPGERNTTRRRELAGLLSWLLLVSAGTLASCARRRPRKMSVYPRDALILIHTVLLVLFLQLIPAAHVYEIPGLLYPEVTWAGKCEHPAARAVMSKMCCAYNVTGSAEEPVFLLDGQHCSYRGLLREGPRFENEACQRLDLQERVVGAGCG